MVGAAAAAGLQPIGASDTTPRTFTSLPEQWASCWPWYSRREGDVCRNLRGEQRDRHPILGGIGKKCLALPGTLIIQPSLRDPVRRLSRRSPEGRRRSAHHSTAVERRLVSMKNTLKLVTIMVALSVTSVVRGGLALAVWTAEGPHLGAEGPSADMAAGRSEGALDGPDGRRFRRTRCQRRERVSVGPRREGGRHAARARSGEWQGTVDVRLRGARQLHVRRLTHDADRGRRARLHRRADGGSARDQHEDTEAGLAQEHLEGLRRRRANCHGGRSCRIR